MVQQYCSTDDGRQYSCLLVTWLAADFLGVDKYHVDTTKSKGLNKSVRERNRSTPLGVAASAMLRERQPLPTSAALATLKGAPAKPRRDLATPAYTAALVEDPCPDW